MLGGLQGCSSALKRLVITSNNSFSIGLLLQLQARLQNQNQKETFAKASSEKDEDGPSTECDMYAKAEIRADIEVAKADVGARPGPEVGNI